MSLLKHLLLALLLSTLLFPQEIKTTFIVKDKLIDKDGYTHYTVHLINPMQLGVVLEHRDKDPIVGSSYTCKVKTEKVTSTERKDGKTYSVAVTVLDCGKDGKLTIQTILFPEVNK